MTTLSRLTAVGAWAAALGLFGCSIEPSASSKTQEPERVSHASSPIAGGYNDSADTATVGIYDNSAGALCSGSLLAPNMVLTARHCVSDILNEVQGGVDCSKTTAGPHHAASQFFVTTKQTFPMTEVGYHFVKEVIVAPGPNQLLCGNDQTILILADNIPDSEATPMVPRVDSALDKGEQYYAIGYGATNDNGAGAGQRRRRDNLFVNCAETGCKGNYITSTEWEGDTGICEGDSGGPAIDLQGRVVGVTSRGSQGCSSPVYGAVHGWGQWIMDTAVHAAEVGNYPAPPWATGYPTDPAFSLPIGGACDDTCTSGVCLDNQCTRLCNDLAVCPDGYECDAINDTQSACAKIPPPPDPTPGQTEEVTTCALSAGEKDPTNPVPWIVGATLFGAAAWRARRRKR